MVYFCKDFTYPVENVSVTGSSPTAHNGSSQCWAAHDISYVLVTGSSPAAHNGSSQCWGAQDISLIFS